MTTKYLHKQSNQQFTKGVPFSCNGISFPSNWFDVVSSDELKNFGFEVIEELEEPQNATILEPDTPNIPLKVLKLWAFQQESDALFFKEQRGEVPEGTWLAKVQEIRDRYRD